MTKAERKHLLSLPEEVQIIHQELVKRYKNQICLHDGYYYHLTKEHKHEDHEYSYLVIFDHEESTPAQIALYNPNQAHPLPRMVKELNWGDPNLLKHIYSHCDKHLNGIRTKSRNKARRSTRARGAL